MTTNLSRFGTSLSPAFLEFAGRMSFPEHALPGAHCIDIDAGIPDWTGERPGEVVDHFVEQVSQIYAPDRIAADLTEAEANDGDLGGWHLSLVRLGCPIGQTYSGDLLLEIRSGPRAGEIHLTNHEAWFGMLEYLVSDDPDERAELSDVAEDALDELAIEDLWTVDDARLIAFLLHDSIDANAVVASSFAALVHALRRR